MDRSTDGAKGEITQLLVQWKDGDSQAFEKLVPLVYPHLREVAGAYLRRERNPGLMQATSLVHELYLRLLNQQKAIPEDRAHFYTLSAKVMRLILIDNARTNQAKRRGGNAVHLPLSEDMAWVEIGSPVMLQMSSALDELQHLDAYKVQLVELRYFLGCTAEETAALMRVSKATVDRDLKFVKAWLYRKIYPDGAPLATTD